MPLSVFCLLQELAKVSSCCKGCTVQAEDRDKQHIDSMEVHLILAVCRRQASIGSAKQRLSTPAACSGLQPIHCC